MMRAAVGHGTATAPIRAVVDALDRRFRVIGATLLAASLSTYRLGAKSFWHDEGESLFFSSSSPSDFIWLVTTREGNQSLYYLLLRPWLLVANDESGIRLLSALFAIGSVPLIYALVGRIIDRPTGVVASLLLALNGFFIHCAQEARGYSLVLLLTLIAANIFVRVRWDSWRRAGAYGVVAGTALYAHVFAGFVLVAHALFACWRARGRSRAIVGVAVAI